VRQCFDPALAVGGFFEALERHCTGIIAHPGEPTADDLD
jgi:hypothetical protein